MAELHDLTAVELWTELHHNRLSPREVAAHYIERIQRLNSELGAFVTLTGEAALTRADEVADHVPSTAPLWGLPLADKDLWMRSGVPTAFGSRVMTGFVPDSSDEIVTQLDTAGAISLGKTAVPEFGLPCYTEPLGQPPARNPWNLHCGAGGSSGGAAVAVASGMLPFAPGSDGGGSIRIPAAACGLVGLKPSRGRIPAGSGIDSLAGLVVNGPLARTTADAALLLDGMITRTGSRIDHHYALRAPDDGDTYYLGSAMRAEGRFQLGVMTTSAWDDAYEIVIAPEAHQALRTAVTHLDELGHGIEEVALEPDATYASAFRTIWQAGAARIPCEGEALSLLEPLTSWLVKRGRSISARELVDALATLTAYERSFIRQLALFDAVLTPALALTPRPLGWYDADDPENNFAQQVQYTPFTSMVNVTGLPAIVIPILVTDQGLPMGVQLIGRPGGERTLFALASQLERRVRWDRWRPPVW